MKSAERIVNELIASQPLYAEKIDHIKKFILEAIKEGQKEAIHEMGITMHMEMMERLSVLYHDGRKREYEETVYDQMEKKIINDYKL